MDIIATLTLAPVLECLSKHSWNAETNKKRKLDEKDRKRVYFPIFKLRQVCKKFAKYKHIPAMLSYCPYPHFKIFDHEEQLEKVMKKRFFVQHIAPPMGELHMCIYISNYLKQNHEKAEYKLCALFIGLPEKEIRREHAVILHPVHLKKTFEIEPSDALQFATVHVHLNNGYPISEDLTVLKQTIFGCHASKTIVFEKVVHENFWTVKKNFSI